MILNGGKRFKQITATVLVFLLTVSIVLTASSTIAKAIMVEKGANNIDEDFIKEWDKTYGGPNIEAGYWVDNTTDRGYIVVGTTESHGAGNSDVWLIKTGENGNEVWNKTFGGSKYDAGRCVAQTADGGYIIVGYTKSFGAGKSDVYIIKTDSDGNLHWNKTFGGENEDVGYSVLQTSNGGYLIAGETDYSLVGGIFGDIWLIKTNSSGDEEWSKTYGGTSMDSCYCVVQTVDGGYIIAGYKAMGSIGFQDVLLIKIDENGNILLDETFGEIESDLGYCVVQIAEGEYVIVGFTASYGAGGFDVWLIKVSSSEAEEWFSWGAVLLVLGVIGVAAVLVAFFMKRKQES